MNSYFLDTTVVVKLCFGSRRIIEIISSQIDVSNSRISRYVYFEYCRGYLRNIINLHNRCSSLNTFSEVIHYVRNSYLASHRQGSHLEAIEKFFAENGNAGAFTQEELLLFFKGWLKREIRRGHTRVKRYFPVHNNAVGCKANVPDPELNDDQYLHDLKTDRCGFYRECGLKKYIAEHVSDFINLREVLLKVKPADSETKKRIQSLKKLYRIRDRDFSRSDCFRCGDALIAHECSDKEFLATTNAKHFKDICHSFTKPLLTVNLNLASKPESA